MTVQSAAPVLKVDGLAMQFGGVRAVNDVSFQVGDGQILGLIGPNGAGKTTTFNMISARYRPTAGTVTLRNEPITTLKPHQIAARGIARTFQGTRIFRKLTVLQNVQTAVLARTPVAFWPSWLGTRAARTREAAARDEAFGILRDVGLDDQAGMEAGNLAYAHQSLLGIGLALALRPTILLLDEPLAGMNPGETQRGAEMILGLRDRGLTILLVEHDMGAVMQVCDRIVVLDHGVKIAEGTPKEVSADEAVIAAYLGADIDA